MNSYQYNHHVMNLFLLFFLLKTLLKGFKKTLLKGFKKTLLKAF